jgi:hypothetical protein
VKRLAVLGRFISAASVDGVVYAWRLEPEGRLVELGGFWCDSEVRTFCVVGGKLFYGTEGGGIGCFAENEDEALPSLRELVRERGIVVVPDRTPPALSESLRSSAFVDLDTLAIIRQLPSPEITDILGRADLLIGDLEDICR